MRVDPVLHHADAAGEVWNRLDVVVRPPLDAYLELADATHRRAAGVVPVQVGVPINLDSAASGD